MLEKLIKEKKFDEAIKYLETNNSGENPVDLFNLAYLNFQKSDFIKARFFLEKAKKSGLYSQELKDALLITKRELGIETIENSYYKEDFLAFTLVGFKPVVYETTLGIALLFTLIFFGKSKKVLGSIFLSLTLLLGSLIYYIQDFKTYINENDAVVYEGPSKIFSERQILIPGMKVIINQSTPKWNYILYPKAYRGWAYEQKAKKL